MSRRELFATPEEGAAAGARLQSLDFGPVVDRLTEGFIGREWAFTAVRTWLAQGGRFLLVTGDPGAGKSAFAARYTQLQEPTLLAAHFCLDGRAATLVPETFVRSLAAQMAASLPGYGEALANTLRPEHLSLHVDIDVREQGQGRIVGVVIHHLHAASVVDLFDILLRRPLDTLAPPPSPRVVVVDSLDTAVTYGDANLVRLLAGAASDFPPWVRFLCTTRPEERRVLQHFPATPTVDLSAPTEDNGRDLVTFVEARAASGAVQATLREAGVAADSFTHRLLQRAAGNFLYASVVLADIVAGLQAVDDLDDLPRGLDEIYARFLQRFGDREWQSAYAPLFRILAAAQAPLTTEALIRFSGLPATAVNDALRVAGQFLPSVPTADGKGFTFFHASLPDFLADRQRNRDRWLAPEDGHRQIASACLEACGEDWGACDQYTLSFLPLHLAGASERAQLRQLLLDYGWLEAKLQRAGVAALLEDFGRATADKLLNRAAHVLQTISYLLVEDPQSLAPQLLAYLPHEGPYRALRDEARRQAPADSLLPLTPGLASGVPSHLVRQFRGHGTRITALALLSRQPWLVSADDDGLIKIWDRESSALLRTLRGHRDKVKALSVSPDERLLASAAPYVGEIILWDLETGEARWTLAERATGLAFTAGGSLVTVAPERLALWDLGEPARRDMVDGRELTAPTHMEELYSLGDAPAVTVGAAMWLADAGLALPLLPSAWSDHLMLALFGGSDDGDGFYEQVRDLPSRVAHLLEAADRLRCSILVVHAEATLYAYRDGQISSESGRRWRAHPAPVTALALDRKGTAVASGDERGGLRLWRLEGAAREVTGPPEIGSFGLASSGAFALAAPAGRADVIARWPLVSPTGSAVPPEASVEPVPPAFTQIWALLPDQGQALSAGDGAFVVWEISSGEAVAVLACDPADVRRLAVSADGRFVAAIVSGFGARGAIRGRLTRAVAGLRRVDQRHLPVTLLCFETESGRRCQRISLDGIRPPESAGEPGPSPFWEPGSLRVERLAISADGAYAALLFSNRATNRNKGGDYTVTVVFDLTSSREMTRSPARRLGEFDPIPALAVSERGEPLTAEQAVCTRRGVTARAARATLSLEAPGSASARFAGFLPLTSCQLAADGRTIIALDAGGYLHFLKRPVSSS